MQNPVTEPIQYPGSIEVALYLVHEALMDEFECHLIRPIWNAVSGRDEAGVLDFLFIWFCGVLTLVAPYSWASNSFTSQVCVSAMYGICEMVGSEVC